MFDIVAFACNVNAFGVPALGFVGLIAVKLSVAQAVRRDRMLFATLMLVLAATCRSLLTDDSALLIHSLTLALLILGAILVPQARSATTSHPAGL